MHSLSADMLLTSNNSRMQTGPINRTEILAECKVKLFMPSFTCASSLNLMSYLSLTEMGKSVFHTNVTLLSSTQES